MKTALPKSNWLRIISAGLGVIAATFVCMVLVTFGYAMFLAIQARGTPNQTAINHFAATLGPRATPWLELFWAFFLSFRIGRKTALGSSVQGLYIGIVAGVFSLFIPLCFNGSLSLFSLFLSLGMMACGYLGGKAGEKWPARK